MALYPYQCEDCGMEGDAFLGYDEMKAQGFPPCGGCGSRRTIRKYTPASDPNGESAYRPVVTEMLNPTGGPEEFRSRREWKERMDQLGVQPKAGDYRSEVSRINRERRRAVEDRVHEARRMLHDRGVDQNTREADAAWTGNRKP